MTHCLDAQWSGYDYCHCRHNQEATRESPYGISHRGSHHLAQGYLLALLLTVIYRHGKHAEGGDENRDEHEGEDERHGIALRLYPLAQGVVDVFAMDSYRHAPYFFRHLTTSILYGGKSFVMVATGLDEHGIIVTVVRNHPDAIVSVLHVVEYGIACTIVGNHTTTFILRFSILYSDMRFFCRHTPEPLTAFSHPYFSFCRSAILLNDFYPQHLYCRGVEVAHPNP